MGRFSRPQHPHLPCGAVVRHRALGSEALYEVLTGEDDGGAVVTVAVLEAPGLAAGTRVRLMRDAVAAMERLELHGEPLAQARTPLAV